MKEQSQKKQDVMTRRDFCRKALKRSSIATAAAAAGYLAYKKPAIRSFFGVRNAYASGTPGEFTLTGDSD